MRKMCSYLNLLYDKTAVFGKHKDDCYIWCVTRQCNEAWCTELMQEFSNEAAFIHAEANQSTNVQLTKEETQFLEPHCNSKNYLGMCIGAVQTLRVELE